MTNAEINLQEVLRKRESGELNAWEINFVSQFENYTKKDLRKLSSKQFLTLRKIANKK